ncbi:putative glycoside hydrolase [Cellvibrio sp. PSBB006]|uniref:putative glycoside hydrolase n=1 Tax=Cellvibrio sp. PSBB006 TaxID=1987723 RepID=UPI000B3B38F8|nr:putative glycoside hydrolase [Cellvibrio sp. PSBB006]ARU29199.1 hypothetical protein CBR65_18140 [Cellvibrio sp. PSBB006]
MKHYKYLCLIGMALAITACGGGNGGKVNNPSSSVSNSSSSLSNSSESVSSSSLSISSSLSSSSSSESSTASEPYASCAEAEGGVFINDVCSPWRDVSAYEQRQDPFEWEEVTDGEGNAVTYAIIDTDDPEHNQVLNIQFAEQTTYAGNVRMLSPENSGYDMSEFAGGTFIFDLKVVNAGDQSPDVEFYLDCVYPCATSPKLIKSYVINEWQTIEVLVQDLVERGLDLTKVTTGFMIAPTWGKSSGAHYQVDNIRWEKGDMEITESICFANHFDLQWISGVQGPGITIQDVDFLVPDSQRFGATIGVHPVELKPDWSLMQGVWAFSMSEGMDYTTGDLIEPSTLSECSSAGTLSLEIFVPKSYVDDGSLSFTFHVLDESLQRYELSDTVFSMADMTPDDWNKVSIPLSAETQHDNLKYVGLTFDSTLIDWSIEDALKIDNIIIKQPLPQ